MNFLHDSVINRVAIITTGWTHSWMQNFLLSWREEKSDLDLFFQLRDA